MRELFKKLIQDESGVIVSTEIVLVGTILVLGCMTGLSSLSYVVNQELNDVAQACYHSQNGNSNQDDDQIQHSEIESELVGQSR